MNNFKTIFKLRFLFVLLVFVKTVSLLGQSPCDCATVTTVDTGEELGAATVIINVSGADAEKVVEAAGVVTPAPKLTSAPFVAVAVNKPADIAVEYASRARITAKPEVS